MYKPRKKDKLYFKVAQCLLPHALMYYSVARSGMTAVIHVFLVYSFKQRFFWLNIFSSTGKNNCLCLFTVAWNWTGNTIVTTYRFFLNSDTGMNPALFRRGKWERGRIYLCPCECRDQTCQITVHIYALTTGEGSWCQSPISQRTPQPPAIGYSEVGLSLPASPLHQDFFWYKHINICRPPKLQPLFGHHGTTEGLFFSFIYWQIISGCSFTKGQL